MYRLVRFYKSDLVQNLTQQQTTYQLIKMSTH